MSDLQKLASLEALLFIHGEPLQLKKIAETLGIGTDEAKQLVADLAESLTSPQRGLTLLTHGGKIQLATNPACANLLKGFVKEQMSEELTPASLEALAIVCYFGPVTRNRIEYLRGVNSAVTLRNLQLRGLIERVQIAGGYAYQPTFDVIKHLGLSRVEELPEHDRFKEMLARLDQEAVSESV
jgi:segregation and condensation protein B